MVRISISIGGRRVSDHDFSHISVHQRIGGHHDFEIRLRQDANRGALANASRSWIGKPVNIGIDLQADESLMLSPLADSFKGIVTSVSLSRFSGAAELVVLGQSPTIIAEDGPNTRSFTDKSLQEIVDEVLAPYKSKFPNAPTIDPQVYTQSLPYVVQYKESNFSFISRLASRYGEWVYYDGLNLYFGKPSGGETTVLDFGENGLSTFNLSVRAIPSKFKLQGYDYMNHQPLTQEAPLNHSTSKLGIEVLSLAAGEIFSQTPSTPVNTYLDQAEFSNIVERREQVVVDEIVVLSGSSRNASLKVGSKIDVRDNTIGENYGIFTIIDLTHDIGQGGDYANHFEAIPQEVKTPPLSIMPDPPFCETQLAKVTDVDDDKKLGRVRVKFMWQEGSDEKSPWLRVASPYTGKDQGFYIIPEVGDQVLVAFENNHPDKPYVLTGMYNGDAKPEWFDAKNKYKGFKSKGGNKWKFDDNARSVSIHAPNSILMTAGKTISIRSGKKDDDSSMVMSEGKEITFKTNGKADSSVVVDAGLGTIHIIAKTIILEASELIDIKSQQEVKVQGLTKVETKSMEIKGEGSQKVEIKGAQIDITGAGPVNIKGLPIKLN